MRIDVPFSTGVMQPATFQSANPIYSALAQIGNLRLAAAQTNQAQGAAAQSQAQANIGIPAAAQNAIAQAGLYGAQATIGVPAEAAQARSVAAVNTADINAGLPQAQASQDYGAGAQSRAMAANLNLKTNYPLLQAPGVAGLIGANDFLGMFPGGRYTGNPATIPQSSGGVNSDSIAPVGPQQQMSNQASGQGQYYPGVSLMSANPQLQGQQPMQQGSQASPPINTFGMNLGNLTNSGSMQGIPPQVMQSMIQQMVMGPLYGLQKTQAQTNFYNQRSGLSYSGTDQNGNPISYQPTSPSVVGPTQQRQQAQSEFANIMPSYQKLLSSYTGVTGPFDFGRDMLSSPGTPGFNNAANRLAALDLQPDLSALASKVSLPGGGGEAERAQYISQLNTPVYSHIAQLASPELQAAASQKADEIRNQGLNANVAQERQQFPISTSSTSSVGNLSSAANKTYQVISPNGKVYQVSAANLAAALKRNGKVIG